MAHLPKFSNMKSKGGPRPGETMTGMVKSYNRKGFGFIMCQALDSVDVYFSRESLAPQLQTSDLAGEYVTFDVFRFPDGKYQARNLRPVGDTGITRGPDGFGGITAKGKGFTKGPAPTGGREEEDRSRDWYCEKCNERNFVKRSECFKCKAPRPRGSEAAESTPAPPPPRRTISPHAGSRAMRDMLRKGGGKGGAGRSRSRSRTSRKNRRSSSRRGRGRSNARSRSRRREAASKSSSSDASSRKSRKERKRSQSDSGSSSSSSDSGSGKEEGGAVASSAPQEQKEPANPEIEKAKAEVLQKLLQLQKVEPRETRVRDWRALLREWHPDKNPERTEVATAVFQFLQKGKLLIDTDAK